MFNFFFGGTASTILNLLILAIFLSAVASLILHKKRLVKEWEQLESLREQFSKFRTKTSIKKLAAVFENLDPESIIIKRLQHIHDVREGEGNINVEVINQINDNIPLIRPRGARSIASSLILLGLLGTIVGLSFTLVQLSGTLSLPDTQFTLLHVKTNFQLALAGMNTAFSTSVTGLLLTLGLVYLLYRHNEYLDRLDDELETFLTTKVLAIYQPTKSDQMQDILLTLQENYKSTNILVDNLLKATTKAGGQYDALLGVANTFEKASQNIIGEFEATSRLQQEIRGILAGFKNIAGNIDENAKSFSEKYSDIMLKLQDVNEQNGRLKIDIENLITNSKGSHEAVNLLVNQLDNNNGVFKEAHQELHEVAIEMRQSNTLTTKTMNGLYENVISDFTKSMQTSIEDQMELLRELSNTTERIISNLEENTNDHTQKLLETFEGIGSKLQKFNESGQEKQSEMFEKLQEKLQSVLESLDEVVSKIEDFDWGEKVFMKLDEGTSKINQYIGGVNQIMGKADKLLQGLADVSFIETSGNLQQNTNALLQLSETIRRRGFLYRLRYLLSFVPYFDRIDKSFKR